MSKDPREVGSYFPHARVSISLSVRARDPPSQREADHLLLLPSRSYGTNLGSSHLSSFFWSSANPTLFPLLQRDPGLLSRRLLAIAMLPFTLFVLHRSLSPFFLSSRYPERHNSDQILLLPSYFQMGTPRIATDIRIGTRTDKTIATGQGNLGKIARVEEILGKDKA